MITHSGLIAVIGRPNVGKSTLVNALVGEKTSIVSPKPQTTRHRICAVAERGSIQLVFIDTPGFHSPKTRLGEYMTGVVKDSVSSTDAVLLVVEPIPNAGEPERDLIKRLKTEKSPVFLVINKSDTVPKEKLLEVIALYSALFAFDEIVPISALKKDGLDVLEKLLIPLMPSGPALFPEGMGTDQPDKVYVAEIIREKALRYLQDEIPHGVAVLTETLKEREDGIVEISATLFCERENHKGMIIGKSGSMLQKIGTAARLELEMIYESKVALKLWVKVKENWRDNPYALSEFGLG